MRTAFPKGHPVFVGCRRGGRKARIWEVEFGEGIVAPLFRLFRSEEQYIVLLIDRNVSPFYYAGESACEQLQETICQASYLANATLSASVASGNTAKTPRSFLICPDWLRASSLRRNPVRQRRGSV